MKQPKQPWLKKGAKPTGVQTFDPQFYDPLGHLTDDQKWRLIAGEELSQEEYDYVWPDSLPFKTERPTS